MSINLLVFIEAHTSFNLLLFIIRIFLVWCMLKAKLTLAKNMPLFQLFIVVIICTF